MEEAAPSEAELVVLGLLAEKSQHGYDLDKLIKIRGIRNWANIGFSSIYYILDKLEKKGFVESENSTNGTRRLYSLTAAGVNACKQNTMRLLANRVAHKNPFMVGIANSYLLPDGEVNELLTERRKQLTDQLVLLENLQKSQQPLPKHATYLFSYSQVMINAEIDWIDKIV